MNLGQVSVKRRLTKNCELNSVWNPNDSLRFNVEFYERNPSN